ncbi:MAG: phospho-N-acetylmuramoyl-pentapeptide-transferase [Epsilonproteobacteria bacterium]|nr:MAG: phospho-N-acetylmuramoyl-pentapeptide-transferase [Campylobacterota bacterium]
MLYLLYTYFDINIFQYITVRAGIGFMVSFILTYFLLGRFIFWAKKKNQSQPILSFAPKSHALKNGTPTMGGAVFILSTILTILLTTKLHNIYVWGAIIVLCLFTLIGIKDDILKIRHKKNQAGLSASQKFLSQIVVALIAAGILFVAGFETTFYVPFVKEPIFDMGLFSIIFWVVVIVAASNAVNLTDGLDGLATAPSIIGLFSLSLIAYITGHAVISEYLLMPNIKLSGELFIVGMCLVGSLIAFLWFNSHPAQVFMGDSGSLSIGAFMGYIAIVGKSEILLLLIGFIFVFETVSVILQVGSFKLRKKRIFKMAPIHHHFEQKGWHENKIIVRFWIISFMSNILALISLKIR